jgi:hypothetical protein
VIGCAAPSGDRTDAGMPEKHSNDTWNTQTGNTYRPNDPTPCPSSSPSTQSIHNQRTRDQGNACENRSYGLGEPSLRPVHIAQRWPNYQGKKSVAHRKRGGCGQNTCYGPSEGHQQSVWHTAACSTSGTSNAGNV